MLTLTSPCCFSQYFSSPTHSLLHRQLEPKDVNFILFAHSSTRASHDLRGGIALRAAGSNTGFGAWGSSPRLWLVHQSRAEPSSGLGWQQQGRGSELSLPAELGQAASWIRVLCQAELIWSQSDQGSTENRAAAPLCQLQPQGRSLPLCLPGDHELCPAPDPPSQQSCSPQLLVGLPTLPIFQKKTLQQGKKCKSNSSSCTAPKETPTEALELGSLAGKTRER